MTPTTEILTALGDLHTITSRKRADMRIPQVGQVYAGHEQFGCSCGAGPWGFPPELQRPWYEVMMRFPWTCPTCGRGVLWEPGIQVCDTREPGERLSFKQQHPGYIGTVEW